MSGLELFTVSEAAKMLRMDGPNADRTIRRWIRTGRLKCGYVGRRPVFTIEQIRNSVFMASARP